VRDLETEHWAELLEHPDAVSVDGVVGGAEGEFGALFYPGVDA
jgi:hypothetical protein